MQYAISAIPVIAVVLTLAYASYRDLVSREIPEVVWVPAYVVAVGNLILSGFSIISLIRASLALVPPLTYLTLFLLNAIGGADLLAILLISLTHLDKPLIPLATFVLSSLIPLPLIIVNVVLNVTKYSKVFEEIKCIRGNKKALYIVGRPIRVVDFVRKSFVFLHTIPAGEGFICSARAEADVDFEEQRRRVLEAVRSGFIREHDYVIYSPAIPHVVLIALSYIAVLVIYPLVDYLIPPLP